MKIGYQGDIGSNSEEAVRLFVEKLNIRDFELIPLISSKNVVNYLAEGKIDFGVCAVYNSIGGIVLETKEATDSLDLIIKDKYKKIIDKKIERYGFCNTIIIRKIADDDAAILIQNAFPTLEKYIDHIHQM